MNSEIKIVENDREALATTPNKYKNRFTEFLSKLLRHPNAYLCLCFVIPVVIMYLIYLAMQIHPFGDGSVLVLDLNAQYVYFYEALRDFVWGDNSLLYSFSRQLGGEFMGIYAYYIASPFSYLVALFPKARMLEALLFIFLLKTGLCGLSCGYYLKKTTDASKLKRTNVIIFSVMYALCSYAVVQQNNSMWIDALIWLPILTLAIENLIKYRKFKLYVISLAMIIMSNFYIGYMSCIYVALYFFYYYIAKSGSGENNPIKEKTHFAKTLLRIIIYSIIGVGIAAVIIFTAYYSLTFGKTTFTDPSWKIELKFDMMDYLTKFLPGSYDTVRRAGLPFVYCGVLVLFMLPVYFISSKISNREKIMSGVMIAVFSLSFMISVVDLVWHGFQEPNWLNYRYSFMLSFLMIVMAYKGFCNLDGISSKVHLTTAAFITMFLVVAQKYTFDSYNKEKGAPLDPWQTIGFTLLCLAVYLCFLGVYKSAQSKKKLSIVLTVIVCLEMFGNGLSNVVGLGNDVIYSSYSSYNDFMKNIRPVIDKVQANDTSFYRMEKINHRRANDNMALNIKGLTNSSSTLNKETVTILNHFGYSSAAHKSSYYGGNPVNDSLLGVKYLIADNSAPKEERTENDSLKSMMSRYYKLCETEGNYNAYYNPYALSLAYGVSDEIYSLEFFNEDNRNLYFTPYDKLNAIISAMLGSDETVEVFKEIKGVEPTTTNCALGYADGHVKYSPEDSSSATYVNYTFKADRDGDIYFYLPSVYPREVELTLNGDKYGTFYGSDTSRILLLGYFEKGDTVTLKMKLKASVLYVKSNVSCFYYLDDVTFENVINSLSETQLVIDDDFSDDHIKGSILTDTDNQTIFTTIPYDEGWKIKVDGKPISYSKALNSVIAFDIESAGEHKIEFLYRSDAFVYGMTITVFFTLVYIALIVFEKPVYKFIYTKLYDETENESTSDDEEETEPDSSATEASEITEVDHTDPNESNNNN